MNGRRPIAGMFVERRLTAILAADVVGYSRLMGANEVGTLDTLKAHRRDLVDAKIDEHQGRIVKLTGDGMLVEFPSVVNAVACAADIQRKMQERNVGVPEDRCIEFRIGINLGDVIVEGGDILATASMLPRVSKASPYLAASRFPPLPAITWVPGSTSPMTT
jgi:class 3 adenylate cyclase